MGVRACLRVCVYRNSLLFLPSGDFPMELSEPLNCMGEQGMESESLMFSSLEEVSDRRDSRGGRRPVEMVRTLGDPQGSSCPRRTVLADF